MLVGEWNAYQSGVDSNNNGTWDADERVDASVAGEEGSIMFKSDGTGTVTYDFAGTPLSLPLKWNLQNNDQDLRVITTFVGDDTTVMNIVTLNSSDLVTRDMESQPVSYASFKKK